MTKQELTYWITLALLQGITTRRKNEIYAKCLNCEPKLSIIDLFEKSSYWNELQLNDSEIEILNHAHNLLANNSFLVENLLSQGYEIIPIHSHEYPNILKKNLGALSPIVLFVKGNKNLLQKPSIGVVGSRKADNISLEFTKNIAHKASLDDKVVVSGFAKGVDRCALDSALECEGKSIIVLPQGIMTFSSGFKQYYKHIVQGRLLVMSTFAPTAPWAVEFAMARNPIIYGMSSEIFVAQSDNKGGTWSGAIDGLKKNRTIYVRLPNDNEKNANNLLIEKGAIAVDMYGNPSNTEPPKIIQIENKANVDIDERIVSILSKVCVGISSQDLLLRLGVNWNDAKMKRHLNSMAQVKKISKRNRVYYILKSKHLENTKELSLFQKD